MSELGEPDDDMDDERCPICGAGFDEYCPEELEFGRCPFVDGDDNE